MSERAALANRVRALMADRKDIFLRKPADQVREDDRLGLDLGMDSVGILELCLAAESELGKLLDETLLGPATRFGEVLDMLEGRST